MRQHHPKMERLQQLSDAHSTDRPSSSLQTDLTPLNTSGGGLTGLSGRYENSYSFFPGIRGVRKAMDEQGIEVGIIKIPPVD